MLMPMLCPGAASMSVSGPILILYFKKQFKIAYIPLKVFFL